MEIRITHREDRDHAGYALSVRFPDKGLPVLRDSTPTLAGVHRWLDDLLKESPRRRKRQRVQP